VLEPKQTSDDVSVTVEHEGQQSSVSGRYLTVCDGPGGKRRNELGLSIETESLPERSLRQVDARVCWSRSNVPDRTWFFLFAKGNSYLSLSNRIADPVRSLVKA
jgi:2-polyprenyl-6-methoxyphenol hydroxylase-like FAD-dependent oxidoreductase